MRIRHIPLLFIILLSACITTQDGSLSLDEAIREAAEDINRQLEARSIVAILYFDSPAEAFSEYVLHEITYHLVNKRKLRVVEKEQIDIIRKEKISQHTGEVDDKYIQAIGKELGAQAIVTGSIRSVNRGYRFRIRTLGVKEAEILVYTASDLASNDSKTRSLLTGVKSIVETRQSTKNTTTNRRYRIGDTGPAGGIIFYDKGGRSDGWRYLEAAPPSAEFTAEWGLWSSDTLNTRREIGFGKQNTQIILDKSKSLGRTGYAAQRCADMEINGFRDWFLPSLDELRLMYTNLKQRELGGFRGSGVYWSSSQDSGYYAWHLMFSDGSWRKADYLLDDGPYLVRGVRAF